MKWTDIVILLQCMEKPLHFSEESQVVNMKFQLKLLSSLLCQLSDDHGHSALSVLYV